MKSLIKKLLREELLDERLTNIDDDVNLLYTKYFEYDVNRFEETGFFGKDLFLSTSTDTSILKSKECVEANKLNHCIIRINTGDNHYAPNNKRIAIGINANAANFIIDNGGYFQKALNSLNSPQQRHTLSREFTEEKIKGSIHHELVHWIDDTLNNRHIQKRINKATELGTRDIGGINVNSTKFEIQAQIHNIKQLHNKYSNMWDNISFWDMIKMSPSLTSINNQLTGDERKEWIRNIKHRMHREGLLGKNMIHI